MLKIGAFSKMAKVTVKTLRYYEEEGLLIPNKIDASNGYRYYDNSQLLQVAKIISLRQIGLSIEEIKIINKDNKQFEKIITNKKTQLENTIKDYNYQLAKINYLLEERAMKEEIFEKVIPACYVYYKEGVLKSYQDCTDFILQSGQDCMELNPGIKCVIPDYCFMSYLNKGYKEKDIKVRYAQAVIKGKKPFVEGKGIKFMDFPDTKCICIYHKGAYENLSLSYGKIMKYIEDNHLEIIDYFRECYIDGIWNKENVEDWLTEIQIPIK